MVVLVAACGGRATLGFVDDEGAGAGGSAGTTTVTSGTTTSTGAGAGPGSCETLAVELEPVLYDWPDSSFEHALRPQLTPLSDGSLALTAARVPIESPGPLPAGVAHVRVRPWGDAIETGMPLRVADLGGETFLAAPGNGDLAYALAAQIPGPQGEVYVAPSLGVLEGTAPLPPGLFLPTGPARPVALMRWPSGPLLVHWEVLTGANTAFLGFGVIDGDAVLGVIPSESGCAIGRVQAAAVPSGDGAIVAMTSGREANTCFQDDGIPGPPTRWHTGYLAPSTLTTTIAEDVELTEPIRVLELVERSDGAWLVWQTDGSTSEVPPPVFAQALDREGQPLGDVFTIVPAGYLPPFNVTRFGDGLAVAFFDFFDPGPPTLVVRVFDGPEVLAEASTSLPFGPVLPPLAPPMAVSPEGDAILVGWSHSDGIGPIQTGLVRFDCLD